ncbi:MAG: FAD-binding protein [Bacteroidetes bacterium]|jgi:FAD/FMN-containing dehydrogenase|nr:FAD-binding protein [Bacteroidota bacterium]
MTDEHDEPLDWRLLLNRRDFLQVGLASPLLVHDFVKQDSGPRDLKSQPTPSLAGEVESRSLSKDATGGRRPSATERRDYFPLESTLVSVRGLALSRDSDDAELVWQDDQTISLRNLAAWRSSSEPERAFEQHFPNSVRELITPQMRSPTAPRLGELIDEWGSSVWKNWLDDYQLDDATGVAFEEPGWVLKEERIERRRLIGYIKDATVADSGFRAVGSGHSHSEAPKPKKYYTDMRTVSGKLNQPWLWDRETLDSENDINRDHLIRLGAGTILKKLNRDILPSEGLALPNMGAWDGQTLAGAINTSTHGTGLDLGAFADLVRSVEIITVVESEYSEGTPYVRMLRIEPSNGITDPAKFAKDAGTHDMALIQNDDLFHSVIVGYGCMGIVYAYTIEVQDAYWLREENEVERWEALNPVQDARNNRHYSIYVDLIEPQLEDTTNPACLVRMRNETSARGRSPTERSNPFNMEERLEQSLASDDEDFFQEYVEQLNQIQDFWDGLLAGDPTQMFGYNPPFRGGRDETASYIALRRRAARHPNDPDKPPEPPGDAITVEVAVPVSDVEAAVERTIAFVQDNPRFFPAPLGVRFTAGSGHCLSPEYDRPTALIELPLPLPETLREEFDDVKTVHDTPGLFGGAYTNPKKVFFQKMKKLNQDTRVDPHDQETGILDHFLNLNVAKAEFEKLEDILVQEFAGRPHLGKHNTVHANASRSHMQPQTMYPEYEKWLDAYRYLNAFGTFDGAFSDNKTP